MISEKNSKKIIRLAKSHSKRSLNDFGDKEAKSVLKILENDFKFNYKNHSLKNIERMLVVLKYAWLEVNDQIINVKVKILRKTYPPAKWFTDISEKQSRHVYKLLEKSLKTNNKHLAEYQKFIKNEEHTILRLGNSARSKFLRFKDKLMNGCDEKIFNNYLKIQPILISKKYKGFEKIPLIKAFLELGKLNWKLRADPTNKNLLKKCVSELKKTTIPILKKQGYNVINAKFE